MLNGTLTLLYYNMNVVNSRQSVCARSLTELEGSSHLLQKAVQSSSQKPQRCQGEVKLLLYCVTL